jgi:hypothetical protein
MGPAELSLGGGVVSATFAFLAYDLSLEKALWLWFFALYQGTTLVVP